MFVCISKTPNKNADSANSMKRKNVKSHFNTRLRGTVPIIACCVMPKSWNMLADNVVCIVPHNDLPYLALINRCRWWLSAHKNNALWSRLNSSLTSTDMVDACGKDSIFFCNKFCRIGFHLRKLRWNTKAHQRPDGNNHKKRTDDDNGGIPLISI